MIHIDSQPLFLGRHFGKFEQDTIKNEPMLFNCDMKHAYDKGGVITRSFLSVLPWDWHDEPVVVDTRVHMLMPGWYPCIPGWHHDDVPRTRSDGQPNYRPGQDRAQFAMGLANGDICPTEFAIGAANFPDIKDGEKYYAKWDPIVSNDIADGTLKSVLAPSGQVIYFNDRTWHRGTPAKVGGWRWFGRVSRYFDASGNSIARRNERTNEVRRQVQVYLSDINAGW